MLLGISRSSIAVVRAFRTDFAGYEGQFVAFDARTAKVVITDDDPRVVLAAAKGLDHVIVHGRVPFPDEPLEFPYF